MPSEPACDTKISELEYWRPKPSPDDGSTFDFRSPWTPAESQDADFLDELSFEGYLFDIYQGEKIP
jgi:hypothetical protein